LGQRGTDSFTKGGSCGGRHKSVLRQNLRYEQQEFDELADAAVDAIQGLSENDAKALKDALGTDTVRELAEHKFVRIAQAVTGLSR